jgi:hypothetical protein
LLTGDPDHDRSGDWDDETMGNHYVAWKSASKISCEGSSPRRRSSLVIIIVIGSPTKSRSQSN